MNSAANFQGVLLELSCLYRSVTSSIELCLDDKLYSKTCHTDNDSSGMPSVDVGIVGMQVCFRGTWMCLTCGY